MSQSDYYYSVALSNIFQINDTYIRGMKEDAGKYLLWSMLEDLRRLSDLIARVDNMIECMNEIHKREINKRLDETRKNLTETINSIQNKLMLAPKNIDVYKRYEKSPTNIT